MRPIEQIQHERREATRLQFANQVIPRGKKVNDITECAELLIITAVRSGAGVKVNRWLFISIDGDSWSKVFPEDAHPILKKWIESCGLKATSTELARELERMTAWARTEKYKTYLTDILPILRKHMSKTETDKLNIKFKIFKK